MPEDPREQARGNSPWAILGVFGVVFGIVAVVVLSKPLFPSWESDRSAVSARSGEEAHPLPSRFGPKESLEGNALLEPGTSLSLVTCDLPEVGSSKARLRGFYEAGVECLDNAWRPVLHEKDFDWVSPDVKLSAGPSRCGEPPDADRATAFYCSGTIFMPRERVLGDLGVATRSHLAILAHEYGHHVQGRSRTLRAVAVRTDELGENDPKRLEINRRTELQADCFAGLFLGSAPERGVESLFEEAISAMNRSTVGSDTHGTRGSQQEWFRRGVEGDGPEVCDTWSAPASRVR